jgi:hypothetical protein
LMALEAADEDKAAGGAKEDAPKKATAKKKAKAE